MEVTGIIEKIEKQKTASKEELTFLLENITDDELEVLRKKAHKTALQSFGKSIFIRGLFVLSSYCKNDCYYCGIRRSNKNAVRYRLSEEQILDCCKTGYALG
ncbi:MAG: [Clostridia bacterium]|nr:[FeFe] hydrogenase H-cluster radical SAM maturase HydE [Clostridia bacterium]